MNRFCIAATVFSFAFAASAGETVLTHGWRFSKDGGKNWNDVRVPHDWAIAGPFDVNAKSGATGKLPWKGQGLYTRQLEVSAADMAEVAKGGRIYINFDGVMASPEVKLNGKYIGGWDYGYMGFTLDITDMVHEGKNLLEVSCDTRHHNSRWYPGAGIYRRVIYSVLPKGHALPGTLRITTPKVTKESATVKVVYETFGNGPTNYSFEVKNPRLWDVDDPYLYTLELPGQKVRYGIRTFKFTADDGFHLNGRRVQMKGVNLHSDLGPLGMAFDRSAMRRQLAIMKDMGVNALRTSHNPPAAEVLELCDEMGILVWDECFDKWDDTAGIKPGEDMVGYVIRNLRALVKRDRNHPSVVIWSISNEIWEWDPAHPMRSSHRWADRRPDGQTKERNDLFAAAVRLEDDTRPVGCGNRPYMNEKRILDLDLWRSLDVVGWNYLNSYAAAHSHDPSKPVVYSESASQVSTQGYFTDSIPQHKRDKTHGETPQIDSMDLYKGIDIPDVEFHRMETNRYVAGEFVWTGIDYLGEPVPFDDKARSSYFGIVDLMGVPKSRYYLYRAHWNEKADTVHIVPHWNWEGAKNRKRDIHVYTNGDEAELFLNGRSLGRHRKGGVSPYTNEYFSVVSKYRIIWREVEFEPGELTARAWKNGVEIGSASVRTAGTPVAVKLRQERKYSYDKNELLWVHAGVADEKGTLDPKASNMVYFSLSGPGEILGVGNGDPTAMKSFAEVDSHPLFNGSATAVIRRTGEGELKLTVSSPGLKADAITLK